MSLQHIYVIFLKYFSFWFTVSPMSIPPKFLDDLRARLTLSDIVGKRVRLVRAGREFKACCPFHKEKTPSFTINDAKGFYYCFGCGAKGDVVNFVMQHDNLEFPVAVEMLAAEAGMVVPQSTPQDVVQEKKRKDLYDLLEDTAQWFEQKLQTHTEILDYVRERGVSEAAVTGFRIGYAPGDYDSLKNDLKEKGYTEAQMLDAGVLKKSDKDGKTYSFFRDRVMIPVLDMRGRVVAFGGRILPEHMRPPERGDFTPPKYINSPETSVFNKSTIVYGGHQARQSAGQGQDVIVAEGYFDVIACHQAGFKGAVAPMGTALTEEQVSLLWKIIPGESGEVKEPILCFDGDNAGRRAAERAFRLILPLLTTGCSARFAFLPDGEDPDTLIASSGATGFQKILAAALPLFEFMWQLHTGGRSFKTPDSRAALVKALNHDIGQIPDRDVQRHYDTLMRDRVYKAFSPYTKAKPGKKAPTPGAALSPPVRQAEGVQGRILLAALLNYPELYSDLEDHVWQIPLGFAGDQTLRSALADYAANTDTLEREALHTHLKTAGLEKELDDILSQRTYIHASFCAPGMESHDVRQKWLEFLENMQARNVREEVRSGWKAAFAKGDTEEENRLRLLGLAERARNESTGSY